MKDFESPKANLKKFIETSNEAGLSREEKKTTLNIIQSKKEKQRYDEESNLIDRIDSESVEEFTKLISGDEINHKSLVDIGNTLREYGTRGNKEKTLASAEQKIVSLVVKYIENWFYSDGIIKMISEEKDKYGSSRGNNDLAAAAFIINQLAKIKENPQYKETVKNIDSEKLSGFIDEVSDNIPKFFSVDKLDAKITDLKNERAEESKKNAEEFEAASKIAKPFLEKMAKMEGEFSATITKSLLTIEKNIDIFPESLWREKKDLLILFSSIKDELRSYKIPCPEDVMTDGLNHLKNERNSKDDEYLRRDDAYDYAEKKPFHLRLAEAKEKVENDLKRIKENVEFLLKYVRNEANKVKETDSKKPTQKFTGFDALQGLSANLPKFDYKNILDAFEKITIKNYGLDRRQYFDLEKQGGVFKLGILERSVAEDKGALYRPSYQLSALQTARQEYSEIINEFEKSKQLVQDTLKEKNSPAALYFIKSLLIIAAEMRGKEANYFNPRSINPEPDKRKPVYGFEHGVQSRFGNSDFINESKTFDRIHFEPRHIMCAQFTLEYQRQKYNKTLS